MFASVTARHLAAFFVLLGIVALICLVLSGCAVTESQTTVGLSDNGQTGDLGLNIGETLYFGPSKSDSKTVKPLKK